MPVISKGQNNGEYHRLAVLGEADVGTSAIITRFCENDFSTERRETLYIAARTECVIDNVPATLNILDVGGAERHTELQEFTMEKSMGCLLVFSITDLSSFVEIQKLHRHICVIKNHEQFPMVLVGNKADMDSEREVSVTEAQKLANQLGIPYIECSAASGMSVEHAFHELVRIVRKFNMSKEQRRTAKKY